MAVDDQFGETQYFPTQVERVPEPRLLALLGRQGLDGLQVEVVVEVQVVEVLAVDKQVQHVVALLTDLQTHLHPVQRRRLEKLGSLERSEQVSETNVLHLNPKELRERTSGQKTYNQSSEDFSFSRFHFHHFLEFYKTSASQ